LLVLLHHLFVVDGDANDDVVFVAFVFVFVVVIVDYY
jgi:hypothetical protein